MSYHHHPDAYSAMHGELHGVLQDIEWNQEPNTSPLVDTATASSPPINSPTHALPSASTTIPPSFIDLPPARTFMPQYWSSSVPRNDSFPSPGAPFGGQYPLPPPAPSNTPLYPPGPPLTHRASVPNLRVPPLGMGVGHGPPPLYPGHSSHNPWPTVAPAPLDASTGFAPMASPTFPMPVTPLELVSGGHRPDPGLLSPMDCNLTRTSSSSSMGSSIDSGMGQYYTPMSAPGGSDYFHEAELRRVLTTVGGHNDPREGGHGFGATGVSAGTIDLARIHGRTPPKLGPTRSMSDSESYSHGAPSIHHPSPTYHGTYNHLSSPVKSEILSPHLLPQPIPSPASSVHTDGPGSTWGTGSPAQAPQTKHEYRTPSAPSQQVESPSSPYDHQDNDDDGFVTPDDQDDDDFRPAKRVRGRKRAPRRRWTTAPSRRSSSEKSDKCGVSRTALVKRYPELTLRYPLFYEAVNEDLSMHPSAAPMIGSIPSTVTGVSKCDILRDFYHRGRRKLQQLDAFTARCDPRNDTARNVESAWPDLPEPQRIAIRDVRRKIVERCENYKYTRRDILTKIYGKGNWDPIEHNMVQWDPRSQDTDPARDLAVAWPPVDSEPPAHSTVSRRNDDHTSERQQQQRPERPIRSMPSRSFLRTRPSAISLRPEAAPASPPLNGRYSGPSTPSPPSSNDGRARDSKVRAPGTGRSPAFTALVSSDPGSSDPNVRSRTIPEVLTEERTNVRSVRQTPPPNMPPTSGSNRYDLPSDFSPPLPFASGLGLGLGLSGTGHGHGAGPNATLRPMRSRSHSRSHSHNNYDYDFNVKVGRRRRSSTPSSDWDEASSTSSLGPY